MINPLLKELAEREIADCYKRIESLQATLREDYVREPVRAVPAGGTEVRTSAADRPASTKKKRTMSASARKRISEAQKARWAKQRR